MSKKYTIYGLETGEVKLIPGTYVKIFNESTIPDGTHAKYLGLITMCNFAEFEVLNFKLLSTSSFDLNATTLSDSVYVELLTMHELEAYKC